MVTVKRLSICLVAPAHDFPTGTWPAHHVRSLARSLAQRVDVTVACRRMPAPVQDEPFTLTPFDLESDGDTSEMIPSPSTLDRFAEQRLGGFDVVLEGSWPHSGRVSSWCAGRGIAGVPVICQVPATRTWLAYERSSRYLRRAPLVVAETAELREAIADRWKIPLGRIELIESGVDREVFQPRDQADARTRLGLAQDRKVLLYVGALDRGHNLAPIVEAVDRVGDPDLRLHVIGDGPARAELERRALRNGAVTFHGWLPEVPTFIAAADLCLALDDSRPAFDCLGGYSTQAVRQYIASGRPVALASDGLKQGLVRHLVSGFLLKNRLVDWIQFLQRVCPSRTTLRLMGEAASATPMQSVEAAAEAYLSLCLRLRGPRQVSA